MTGVIVLDGHLKSALTSVRSLGKKGITVVCGAERSSALSCHSRFVAKRFVYTSPKINPKKFIDEIVAEAKALQAKEGQKPVIYSFSDASFLCLSRAYDRVQEYAVIPMPTLEVTEQTSDKHATYVLAQSLNIPTIRTYSEAGFGEVTYPAVVKNRHSIVWRDGKAISGSASFVFSQKELEETYGRIKEETDEEPLVMEFVQGAEFGIEMVCTKGEVIASFAHKRIRSLSPRGGAAVVKETAEETPEVVMMRSYAEALALELYWEGPVMVEFKVNATNGQVLLMEINGRFWGSLPLAVRAGIDFPLYVYELAQGNLQSSVSVSHFVRTRHFLGDCKWLLSVFFANDPLRKILYPSRLKALWDFKREIFISKGDVFRWNDAAPSFFEYVDILNKLWKSKA